MRDYIYSSRRQPCPSCNKDHGCKIFNDGKLWCLRVTGRTDKPDGYRIIGWLHGGMGAVLVPEGDTDRREFAGREREREKENRRKFQSSLSPLSVGERDRVIRLMHSRIGLSRADRRLLKESRSITDGQIDRGLYFSVSPFQDLPANVPVNFPGVNPSGKTLNNRYRGIACPIFDERERAVGLQYRVLDDVGSRYLWPRSRFSSHLDNGELPIAFTRPGTLKKNRLGIVEGIGFKPRIAADRLGQLLLGASGGQHASSPEQLKRYLEAAGAEGIDTGIIHIYPDAGDVNNHHVLTRLASLITLLDSWGHGIEIAWWGQETKEDHDIDELNDLSKITYLPLERFAPLREYLDRVPAGGGPFPGPGDNVRALESYEIAARNAWRKRSLFTATVRINRPFFDFSPGGLDNTLVAVRSPLGTGKTEWVKRLMLEDKNTGWIALGYRNSLLLQMSERCDFHHLHHHDAYTLIRDPRARLCCCVDSLVHFQPEDFDDKYIVIDEVVSVARHLLAGGTMKDRKEKCLELWEEALRRARGIVILDGHLTDWCVNYIRGLAGEHRRFIAVENEYVDPRPVNVNFLDGAASENGVRMNDRSSMLAAIEATCEPSLGARAIVATDSQIQAEALDNLLLGRGLSGIRIDSKTITERWCQEFLEGPDRWIVKNRPDYLIYSPTAEAGLDISIGDYFTAHYCLFFGTIGTSSQMQMMGRLRDRQVKKIVWCAPFVNIGRENFRSPFSSSVERAILAYLHRDILVSLDDLPDFQSIAFNLGRSLEANNDVHFRTACIIAAIDNYERSNLRECLLESLESSNHEVMRYTSPKDPLSKRELKDAVNGVKDANALDIFRAGDIPPGLALQLEGMFGEDWRTRCSLVKARLKSTLPGIENTSVWSPAFIRHVRYDERQFIPRCELFWFLYHPDAAKRLNAEKWAWHSKRERNYLRSFRSRFSAVWALREAGFHLMLDIERSWESDSPDILRFHRRCRASGNIQLALGMNVGKSTPNQWFERCLREVGLKTLKKQVRVGEKRKWVYRIDPRSWDDPYRRAILESLSRRWINYSNGSVPLPDFSLQMPDGKELETVTNPPVNNNKVGSVTAPPRDDEHLRNVIDVCGWLELIRDADMESFEYVMRAVESVFEGVSRARERIWRALSRRTRDWIRGLPPERTRWFFAGSE